MKMPNGALAIDGFTLGNATDANDTTTELTVSIAATHGTLTLGTTTELASRILLAMVQER